MEPSTSSPESPVKKPRGPRSEAERQARRANLAKARTAPREVIYRPTAKRRAASRANLAKAQVARRSPEGNAAVRLNALKHGFDAAGVEETVARLGEDPAAFAAHLERFGRAFLPEDEVETRLVRQLAELFWKRLRWFPALGRLEEAQIGKLFAELSSDPHRNLEESQRLAQGLAYAMSDYGRFLEVESQLAAQGERLLRALLLKRSGGKVTFQYLAARYDPELEGLRKDWKRHERLARWLALSPEERKALLEKCKIRVRERLGDS